ncbi:MAG: hypothetical protein ACYC5M_06620 [Anaerolineae bacterium]
MRHSRPRMQIALVCAWLVVQALGCVPSGLHATHTFVLARSEGDALVRIADDDPLYQAFEHEILGDPRAQMLLNVLEHTTEAMLATNAPTRFRQTVANRPVVVIDSQEAGVLDHLRVQHGQDSVPIELALALGDAGAVNLAHAREAMPMATASLLMELVGLAPPDKEAPAAAREALWGGFAAALETTPMPADAQEGVTATCPLPLKVSHEEESGESERVGAFFCHLLATTDAYYPQKHLLWFASYDAGEMAYGKVLLAMRRMPPGSEASIETFVRTFGETFPAERETVQALAEQALGRRVIDNAGPE